MPRPPLPLGTMGEIRCYPLAGGKFRAMAKYRDYDGVTRSVERVGRTEAAAKNRLREACRDRGRTDALAEITGDTKVSAVAELWFTEIQAAAKAGERSPGTERAYRDRLDKQVIPAIGGLRVREVTVSRIDRLLKSIRERHGPALARTTRTVLSGVFGLAVRHDALTANPVREAARIHSNSEPARALELPEVWDLRAKVAVDQRAVDWDLVDFVDMMLATGLRIGETAAITWPAVDLVAGTVEVRGTVIRVRGMGLIIKWKPKSKSGWRAVELPAWCLRMLQRRHAGYEPNAWDVVFTSPEGFLRDPSNTQADLRDVLGRVGYPDVTSHTFRRTVATLMDRAGLTARAAADQLGHAKVSMTQDHYFGRRTVATGAALVLEQVGVSPDIEPSETCG